MNTETTPILDEDTQAMLDCLRQTATETLDRKRRLGHLHPHFWVLRRGLARQRPGCNRRGCS